MKVTVDHPRSGEAESATVIARQGADDTTVLELAVTDGGRVIAVLCVSGVRHELDARRLVGGCLLEGPVPNFLDGQLGWLEARLAAACDDAAALRALLG